MKKTKHTLLTAAMFAASVSAASANAMTVYANDFGDDNSRYMSAPLYGPPPVTTTAPRITRPVTTTTEPATTVTEINTAFQAKYGPAPVLGDLNEDWIVDVYDYNMLVKAIQDGEEGKYGYYISDVNRDDRVDISDATTMKKYILGKIGSFWESMATVYGPPSYFTTTEPVTTSTTQTKYGPPLVTATTTRMTTVAPLYGPPQWFETELVTAISEELQAKYGPPSYFGLEDDTTYTTTVSPEDND